MVFSGNPDFQERKYLLFSTIPLQHKKYNLNIVNINLNLKEFSLLFGVELFFHIFLRLYNPIKNVINEFFLLLLLNGALMMSLDAVQPVIA